MGQEGFEIEGFSAADGAGQAGVVIGGLKFDSRCGDRRDYDVGGAGSDFPESGGAFFLEFGMRGEILKGKYIARGKRDDGVRIAGGGEFGETSEHRNQVFYGAIVVYDEN